jgi:hypothetical protein
MSFNWKTSPITDFNTKGTCVAHFTLPLHKWIPFEQKSANNSNPGRTFIVLSSEQVKMRFPSLENDTCRIPAVCAVKLDTFPFLKKIVIRQRESNR